MKAVQTASLWEIGERAGRIRAALDEENYGFLGNGYLS